MPWRLPLLVLGGISLALGLWSGLTRLGWALPVLSDSLLEAHGPLMVNGVLATLIGLERAVALRRPALYLGPALTSVGAIALALEVPVGLADFLLLVGSGVIVASFAVIFSRQPAAYTLTLLTGAATLVAGNLLAWAGRGNPELIPWWGSFLVLVIAAERLELNRVLPIAPPLRALYGAALVASLAGCVLSLYVFSAGTILVAVGWAVLALWLLLFDLARKNFTRGGLSRFIAFCLLPGYAWLAVGALLLIIFGGVSSVDLVYDAQLHAVFLGFVLAMVFAHAPVILPAVLGRALPFGALFYLPWAVLNGSVAARVLGDLAGSYPLRAWAGLFNVVSLLLYGLAVGLTLALERSRLRRGLQLEVVGFFP